MQCFKVGGSVGSEKFKPAGDAVKTIKTPVTGDKKANAKSAAVIPKDKEAKVDITTMKKGGRAKKAVGTVKKFNKGGSVANEAKKPSGDAVGMIKSKQSEKKADAPNAATKRPAMKGSDVAKEKSKPAGTSKAKEVAARPKAADSKSGAKGGSNNYKTGGKVKKFDTGGSTGYLTPAQQRTLKAVKTGNYRSSDDNNMNYAQPAPSSSGVKLPSLGPANNFPSLEDYQKAGSPAPWNPKKKGGAIKKFADGGLTGTPTDPSGGLQATGVPVGAAPPAGTITSSIPAGGPQPLPLPSTVPVGPLRPGVGPATGPSDPGPLVPPPTSPQPNPLAGIPHSELWGPSGPLTGPGAVTLPSNPNAPYGQPGSTQIPPGTGTLGPIPTSPRPTSPAPGMIPVDQGGPRIPNIGRPRPGTNSPFPFGMFGQPTPNIFHPTNPAGQRMFGQPTPTSPFPNKRFKTGGKVK